MRRTAIRAGWVGLSLLWIMGCPGGDDDDSGGASDDDTSAGEADDDTGVADDDSAGDDDTSDACADTAAGSFPAEAEEMFHDPDEGAGTLFDIDWYYESGAIIHNGWGSAASDFDNDGDMDLVAYDLFRNDTAAAGNHWLQVRPVGGVTANWAAIGAQVEVDAGGVTTLSHVSGGSGTGCQDSMFLGFGLGSATEADEIRVHYPGGASVTVTGPIAADQRLWVYEDGTVVSGWAP